MNAADVLIHYIELGCGHLNGEQRAEITAAVDQIIGDAVDAAVRKFEARSMTDAARSAAHIGVCMQVEQSLDPQTSEPPRRS